MSTIHDLARRLQNESTEDTFELIQSLPREAYSDFIAVLETTANLINRILVDPSAADDVRTAVVADPATAMANYGVPTEYHGAVLVILGAPSSVTERLGADLEFAPLVPLMLGGLRAAQVAVKVAPRVHAGVKNVAPYVGIGAAVKSLFS